MFSTLPAVKQGEPGLEGVDQQPSGGELTDVLGDEGVRQPGARTGRATFAAPIILVLSG
jgi:hypothetical protein